MVVPVIIVAVGVYFAFAPLGLNDGYAGLILAHTTLAVPFVVVTVLATLAGFDRTLLRAPASLGAPPLTTFRRVTLPLILPGVASGAVFAFAASFDEVGRRAADRRSRSAHAAAADVRRHQRQHQPHDHRGGDDADRDLAAADGCRRRSAPPQRASPAPLMQ